MKLRIVLGSLILMIGLVMISVAAAHADEVTCAAYSQQCGYPEAPASVVVPPDLPKKCWKAKYRHSHKQKCRDYSYWKRLR